MLLFFLVLQTIVGFLVTEYREKQINKILDE
jgi:hypothetical protein